MSAMRRLAWLGLLVWTAAAAGLPVDSDSPSSALYYLVRYGYVQRDESSSTQALLSEEGIKQAVKDFQVFAGLPPTGDLDSETVELMNTPRCGVKDKIGHGTRARRYTLQGSRWKTKELTYRITKYPSSDHLSKEQIDEEIREAFRLWEDSSGLSFKQLDDGNTHIEIRFEKGEHGDGDPFDGPGGTLAHAFFPQFGGDAHFDDQEYWTAKEFKGTNLLQAAAHEFGHSLGLSHSDVSSALMAPFYRGWKPDLRLAQDDVDAIQTLYGVDTKDADGPRLPPASSSPEDTPSSSPSGSGADSGAGDGGNAELCEDPSIDAIFGTGDGGYYVFKGSKYWKLTEDSVESGYPRLISQDWPGLPDDIDAAIMWSENKKTYFFKGSQYWKFNNQQPDSGYPRDISSGFEGIPDDVDAAFVWSGNGKVYFFKGDEYYRFDPSRKPPVGSAYPKKLSNWNLPHPIDAAIKWSNEYTYFFKGKQYMRYNDRRFAVDDGDPPFPRDTGPWWFGCSKGTSPLSTAFLEKETAVKSIFQDVADAENFDVEASDETPKHIAKDT